MKKPLYQTEIDAEVAGMENDTLLEETLDAGGGDDYDGMFTKQGEYRYDALRAELRKRLKDIGFL